MISQNLTIFSPPTEQQKNTFKQANNFFSLGKVLAKKGKWSEAIAAYQKAIKLAPDWEEVKQSLADAENKLQQKTANAQQQQEASGKLRIAEQFGKILATQKRSDLEKVTAPETIKVDSNLANDYHLQGDTLVEKGEKEEAIKVYRKAVEIQPELWEVHHKLGNLLQEREELEAAVDAYNKSIELKSDFCWSHNNLGDVLVKLEKKEEGVNAYRQAVELNPDFSWGYYKLGDLLIKLEDWEGAIKAYKNAIRLNPDIPRLEEKLADVLIRQSNFYSQQAYEFYLQAIQKNPEDLEIYYKALEIMPDDTKLYLSLGNALVEQNNFDEAIVFYQIALQVEPNNPEASLQLDKIINIKNHGFEDVAIESQANIVNFSTQEKLSEPNNIVLEKEQKYRYDLVEVIEKNHVQNYQTDIIVCVHNALEDVKACLTSIIKYLTKNSNLLIINDGSETETSEFLQEWTNNIERATLFTNDVAQGYTKAANKGLVNSNGDYVILLNSDTIVTPRWVEKLVECAESDRNIGIVGPLSNCATWQSVPEIFDQNGGWKNNIIPDGYSLEEFSLLIEKMSEKAFPKVNFVNGFCFSIKRNLLETIGFLDEESFPFGYGEENDFCLRAKKAGFKMAIADHTYVYHSKSKSFGHERRKKLSKQGSIALKSKHPEVDLKALTSEIRDNQSLNRLRENINHYILDKA